MTTVMQKVRGSQLTSTGTWTRGAAAVNPHQFRRMLADADVYAVASARVAAGEPMLVYPARDILGLND